MQAEQRPAGQPLVEVVSTRWSQAPPSQQERLWFPLVPLPPEAELPGLTPPCRGPLASSFSPWPSGCLGTPFLEAFKIKSLGVHLDLGCREGGESYPRPPRLIKSAGQASSTPQRSHTAFLGSKNSHLHFSRPAHATWPRSQGRSLLLDYSDTWPRRDSITPGHSTPPEQLSRTVLPQRRAKSCQQGGSQSAPGPFSHPAAIWGGRRATACGKRLQGGINPSLSHARQGCPAFSNTCDPRGITQLSLPDPVPRTTTPTVSRYNIEK